MSKTQAPATTLICRGLIGHGDYMSTDTDGRVNSTLLVFVCSCTVIFFSYSNGSPLAPWTPEHMRIGGGGHCQQPDSLSCNLLSVSLQHWATLRASANLSETLLLYRVH